MITMVTDLRFLVFSGALREQSINSRLARYAGEMIRRHGGEVDLATMADFDAPTYDQDIEDAAGVPPGPTRLRQRLEASDAFVVCSPEYNASMPGGLKNLIDWVSRFRPQPFNGRHCLLMSASPSAIGGNRGLWALRVPLEHLGARVYPDMFSLANAHQAMNVNGELGDDSLRIRFEQTIVSFIDLVEAAKHYPCAKKAWIEFLGERPDPAIDRVEISA
jgi:chromate reductase, NAD(P)H dehydrogenase (quinone)